jgi:D-glycero-alpha-D-manno-heptose 1-phosphate guanylyltransferase
MEVIVLAGGLGTRLRSIVNEVPKCMATVAGQPFLYYLLKYLSKYSEIKKVILSVGYLHEVIFEWIAQNGDKFPFEFDFSVEETPLGTGGGIRLALEKIENDNVLILNGDTFFDVDLNKFGNNTNSAISIALKPMRNFNRYGTVTLDNTDIIRSFNEKQYCSEGLINGGVYMFDKSKCDLTLLPEKFSFETEVLQREVPKGNLMCFIEDGYFIDIGIPEDYARANVEFATLF